jgi:hypothetical protein
MSEPSCAYQPDDERAADLLRAIFGAPGAMVCLTRCVSCQFGDCPGGDHRWADQDDINHAISIGKPETAEGRCGCDCVKDPPIEPEPEPVVLVSIDGPPCHLCGAPGACGYDAEGRPYIHASWDEDETDVIA